MAQLFVIVSRAEPARHAYLKHVFGSPTVDVILDRRHDERRRDERRRRDVTKDLQTFGWTVVRTPSTSPTRGADAMNREKR